MLDMIVERGAMKDTLSKLLRFLTAPSKPPMVEIRVAPTELPVPVSRPTQQETA
jgi:hypothetical protein